MRWKLFFTRWTKKKKGWGGAEQLSCFRPIRLILQPRLTGRNEKGFKDFPTKNAAPRSFRPQTVASTGGTLARSHLRSAAPDVTCLI